MKREEIFNQIKEDVVAYDPDAEVIIYGSRARGDAEKESDYDILILTTYPVDLKEEQKFRHHLFDLQLKLEISLSVLVCSRKDWESKYKASPIYESVSREGLSV
jgi:predicted nucleotidyltransferase